MALSPWHVVSRLSFDDVAALLVGFDISLAKTGNVHDHEIKEYEEWCRVIVEAAQAGDLRRPASVVMRYDAQVGMSEEGYPHFEARWEEVHGDEWLDVHHTYLRLTLERQEVYRWLRASGIADDDIPEALRVMPKPQAPAAPQDKPVHHRRRYTYLTLIEALALEALDGEIPAEPYKAAAMLQTILNSHGLKLDDEPIAKTVKEILAAREERASDPF